jgi:hypothetical protein
MRSDVGDAFGVGFRENEKRAQPGQKKRIRRKEKHTERYRPAELDPRPGVKVLASTGNSILAF